MRFARSAALFCSLLSLALWAPSASADIDVSGTFRVYQTHVIFPPSEEIWVLTQTGTVLTVEVNGVVEFTGTIDPLTGAFSFDLGTYTDVCHNLQMLMQGTVAADANHFSYSKFEAVPPLCKPGILYGGGVASRCLNAPLGPGDTCVTGEQPLIGTRLLVRDKLDQPLRRKIFVKIIDPSFQAPEPGSFEDPTGWGLGGGNTTLRLARGNEESATLTMYGSGWRGLGTPEGSRGWVFRNPHGVFGPCPSALVKDGLIKATCKGSAIDFSLDEAAQGELAVSIEFGHIFKPYCAVFGAPERDVSRTAARVGVFKASDAPAPASCPAP